MDALILTCGTGGGHNAAAHALEEELLRRGHRVRLMNPYTLQSEQLAARIDQAYVRMVQAAPTAFGVVYQLGNLYRRLPARSPVYFVNARMVPCLASFLAENRFDVILTTHLFPGEILTNMKRKGLQVPPFLFVSTDYTCIPFTEETDCDGYIIPAEDLAGDYTARGIREDRLYPLGIPVRRCFSEPVSRMEARDRLNLSHEAKYVLVAAGSMGAGGMLSTVRLLDRRFGSDDRMRFIIVCGTNRHLSQQIQQILGDRAIVLEHTDRMDLYLKACDLFLTKPGGLSTTEAAVAGTPMIHIAPIPGCETLNAEYFDRRGMSIAAIHHREDLIPAIERLSVPDNCLAMTEKQRRINPNAASDICDLAERFSIQRCT